MIVSDIEAPAPNMRDLTASRSATVFHDAAAFTSEMLRLICSAGFGFAAWTPSIAASRSFASLRIPGQGDGL